MKSKTTLIVICVFFINTMFSQVGIGTTTPDAALDINSNNDGLLIPRIGLTSTLDNTTVVTLGESELVYNTSTVFDVTPGFYYWNGAKWVKIKVEDNKTGWFTSGNMVTASDFLGTLNNLPLKFKVNNQQAGFIGNSSSSSTLIGYQSGVNTTTNNNVGLGFQSLYNNNGFGNNHTAIGYQSLFNNLSGSNNTAIGMQSAFNTTVGYNNVSVGSHTLYANLGGSYNTAIGDKSQYNSTVGHSNVSIGYESLFNNIGGPGNTAIGFRALYNNPANFGYSTALGINSVITATNQVRIGSNTVSSIGGFVGWTNLSDKRFKKNINNNVPGLDFIMKLKPVTYNLDIKKLNKFTKNEVFNEFEFNLLEEKEAILYTGFIAQEVEEAANSVDFNFSGVDKPKNKDDYYGLRYSEFVVPLVKAIQEQNVKIKELEYKILQLESLIRNNND